MKSAILVLVVAQLAFGCRSEKRETFTEQQVTGAKFIVASLTLSGAVREWKKSGPVIVEAPFRQMGFEQRQNACRALDIARQIEGLKPGFSIQDAASHRRIGRYREGRLHMKT